MENFFEEVIIANLRILQKNSQKIWHLPLNAVFLKYYIPLTLAKQTSQPIKLHDTKGEIDDVRHTCGERLHRVKKVQYSTFCYERCEQRIDSLN